MRYEANPNVLSVIAEMEANLSKLAETCAMETLTAIYQVASVSQPAWDRLWHLTSEVMQKAGARMK
jgi:hypothetical protein